MMETVGFIFGQLLHTGGTNAICGDYVAPCLLSGDYAMVAIDEEEEEWANSTIYFSRGRKGIGTHSRTRIG